MNPDFKDPLSRALALPGMFDEEAAQIIRLAKGDRWYEALRMAKMHAVVFESEVGKVLLDHWIKTFVCRPIVRPHEDAYAQGIREGQADVVRQILTNIEIAKHGPPENL